MASHNLKDNVALFATLVPEGDRISARLTDPSSRITAAEVFRARGPPIVVANTHLLFNPKRGDIKVSALAIPTNSHLG